MARASSQAASSSKAAPARNGQVVTSPLSGNVVDILVNPGQNVSEGETLLTLEAMKMETSVASLYTGTVQEILVNTGDAVENGQQLLVISAG